MSRRFEKVGLKIEKITTLHRYSGEDARQSIFRNLIGIVDWTLLNLNILSAINRNVLLTKEFENLKNMDSKKKRTWLKNIEKQYRMSFSTLLNFQVENFLKNVLAKLQRKDPPENFSTIIEQLLYKITISDPDSKQILQTPARLRNTLHSNGIHTKDTITLYTIDGFDFEFIKGQKINCGTWYHLCVCMNRIIDVLDEITLSPEVKIIPEPINKVFIPSS